MRATILKVSVLVAIISMPFVSLAQNKSNKNDSKVRIKVEKEIDGKKEVYERSFDASNMSTSEKNEMISKIQDSLLADSKGKNHKLKIEVDEGDGRSVNDFHFESEDNNDDNIMIERSPRVRIFKDGDGDDFMKEFRIEMDDLGNKISRSFRDMPRFNFEDTQVFPNSSSKTIKDLNVYPNKPKTETLNVRFYAPEKGNVNIKVMDTKGTIIAKEEVKDFSGEFVGQISIPKSEGVVFVMVTQGEDGLVKRVVLKNSEEKRD